MRSSPEPELVEAPAPSSGGRGSNATATSEWGPFRNAASYGANMALVVGILLSAFVLGLLFVAAARFFLRRCRRSSRPAQPAGDDPEKPGRRRGGGGAVCRGPLTMYAAGATELAGAAAECAICLTEFAEGDALRVLPACRHGFHAECVETWLASYAALSQSVTMAAAPSCPVCRASCVATESSPESKP